MGLRFRWLVLCAGLVLLPSAARGQAQLMPPQAAAPSDSAPIFPQLQNADVPVLFEGSLSSLRFNAGGVASGLERATWSSEQRTAWNSALPEEPPAKIARGQFPEVPPVIFTGPLSHPRYDAGGVFAGMEGLMWITNRPLRSQSIAIRGFRDLDGAVSGKPGTFVGSGEEALNTEQLMGPGYVQPGWNLFLGYRFENGVSVELSWIHLVQARYHATAALISPSFDTGPLFENTFLFSQVSNFTTDWAGPAQKIPNTTPATLFGIWNGASFMQIEYIQRFDMYQINARIPAWQTADFRSYGLFGPRIAWIWDSFRWTTADLDVNGQLADHALYYNTISNRLYGVHFGWGSDYWLGSTPIGGFAATCELEGALYLDTIKVNAGYTLNDGSMNSGRGGRRYTLSPGAEARLGLWYYPWEAISINVGYDIITFFNTYSSHRPVDFNLGQVDPAYNYQFLRYWHGIRFGINFVF
jgi:hypothetical protein